MLSETIVIMGVSRSGKDAAILVPRTIGDIFLGAESLLIGLGVVLASVTAPVYIANTTSNQ